MLNLERDLIQRSDGVNFIYAIEGMAPPIIGAIERYSREGRIKGVNFLLEDHPTEDCYFLAGNVYYPEVCTMTVTNFLNMQKRNTSLLSFGTGEIALELLVNFAEVIGLESEIPSQELRETLVVQLSFYQTLLKMCSSKERYKQILTETLRTLKEKYHGERVVH